MKNDILKKIAEYSKTKPEEIACRYLDESISWKNFENETNQIAHRIKKKLNGNRHVPIIILATRGITYIKYIIAIIKCDCYYIPLELNFPTDRLKYIVENSNARLVLTDKIGVYEKMFECEIECCDDYMDESNEELISEVCLDDLVYVIYTSGTTGNPKGVKIKHFNLLNLIHSFSTIVYGDFTDSVSIGVISPFSFDASVKQIFCSLYYGHTLCIADETVRNFGRKIHNFHNSFNLTLCDATPSLLEIMTVQRVDRKSKTPYILIGGEVLHWTTLHRYINFTNHMPTFINVYGPTECCVDVAFKIISYENLKSNKSGIVPIGTPLRNTTLTIRTSDEHIIHENDIQGELYISGKQVGAGYVNCESDSFFYELDSLTYKTGDIGYINKEHEIVVIGRNDTQVKINGHRIELEEIKQTIMNYLFCQCCVVYCHVGNGEKIIAYICNQSLDDTEKTNLKAYLKKQLPKYMMPQFYIFGEKIPLTANGKIDTFAISQLLNENSQR